MAETKTGNECELVNRDRVDNVSPLSLLPGSDVPNASQNNKLDKDFECNFLTFKSLFETEDALV